MKKNFTKIVCFMFAVSLGCTVASAERKLPMNEVKPASVALPAITVPADQVKEKIEEKVVTPALDAKGEVIKTGKETNAPLSEIKNKENLFIEQKADGNVEVQTLDKPVSTPEAEKETVIEEKAGTIFDTYGVKENLKINNPSK